VSPEATPDPEPRREKVAAKDAKIFAPSSFASRRADAERNNAARSRRRLVSLGKSEFTQRDTRTSELEVIPVELFYDLDHPRERYAQFPGQQGLTPLQDDSGLRDAVVPLPGRVSRRCGPSAMSPEAQPDPPPRPI